MRVDMFLLVAFWRTVEKENVDQPSAAVRISLPSFATARRITGCDQLPLISRISIKAPAIGWPKASIVRTLNASGLLSGFSSPSAARPSEHQRTGSKAAEQRATMPTSGCG